MKRQKSVGHVKEEIFVLKALTHKQLAQMYGVSWLTFQNWIKRLSMKWEKTGHFYHIHQVKKIFQLFGLPKQIIISTEDVETIFKN
ncbi:MAG: hypothetical protein HWD62_14715 [Cyclobacteriaceae bacterium]|nr:MAG: hypothetical protein HWD62_14715 [Cyclobacteriaceae bacterium]